MNRPADTNKLLVAGRVLEDAWRSHESHGREYYRFTLEIARSSGAFDTVNVILPGGEGLSLVKKDAYISVTGALHTHNNRTGEGARLIIFAYAYEISAHFSQFQNMVELSGRLCKAANFRVTPLGREICDLLIAVKREYDRRDFIPCIVWGSAARENSFLETGAEIIIEGRIQSRNYTKLENGILVPKIAFEVSVSKIKNKEDFSDEPT